MIDDAYDGQGMWFELAKELEDVELEPMIKKHQKLVEALRGRGERGSNASNASRVYYSNLVSYNVPNLPHHGQP